MSEVNRLKRKLQELTQVKITSKRLIQAIKRLHRRQSVFRRLHQLRKYNPPLINGRDFLLVTQASFYDDIDRWTEKTKELCTQLEIKEKEAKVQNFSKIKRLLLTGAPIIWPNYKLINTIEEAGAVIVIDELCSGTRHLYDPVEVEEWTMGGCLQAIANRYFLPSTCPCFTTTDDRIDKLLSLIEEFRVNGVIYHSLRLCQLYDIESRKIKYILKNKGIPMLSIHTDYSYEDIAQIKTRVEAFLEIL